MGNLYLLLLFSATHNVIFGQTLNTIIKIQNVQDEGFLVINPRPEMTAPTVKSSAALRSSSEQYVITWRVNWGAANRKASFMAANDAGFLPFNGRYLCVGAAGTIVGGVIGAETFAPANPDVTRCSWRFMSEDDPTELVKKYRIISLMDGQCLTRSCSDAMEYCLKPCPLERDDFYLFRIILQ